MKTWSAIILSLCTVSMTSWAQQLPDFSLRDANEHSLRAGTMVSPRDYLLQVSGYYFGTAG
jgi:hypothetical protein